MTAKVLIADGAEGARCELQNPAQPPVAVIARELVLADLPPGSVMPTLLPGETLGLPIDAAGSGPPEALTGNQLGENLRFRSNQTNGVVGLNQTVNLIPAANWLTKSSGASSSVDGITGGAAGRILMIRHTSGGLTTSTLNHDVGAVPSDGIMCPGNVPFLYGGTPAQGGGTSLVAGFLIYDPISERWLVFPRGLSRAEPVTWTGEHTWTTAGNFVVDANPGEVRIRTSDGMCLVAGHANYVSVAAGDLIVAANSGVGIAATAVPPTAAVTTGFIDCFADSGYRISTNGVERLRIASNGEWQVGAGLAGTAGQVLVSSGGGPPAWSTVSQAGLNGGILASLLGTTPTATNATTDLSVGSVNVAANTTVVGTTYISNLSVEFVHTAAATPTLTIEWVYGGVVVCTRVLTVTAVAGTYTLWVEGYFRHTTIGAASSARVSIRSVCTAGATVPDQIGDTTATPAALNTTIARTLELRVRMTTAVAANTITLHQAILQRLINQ